MSEKISDAQIDRAAHAIVNAIQNEFNSVNVWTDNVRKMVAKAALEAALAPQEPEIEVTQEMAFAGDKAWSKKIGYSDLDLSTPQSRDIVTAIYRAMRELEPPTPTLFKFPTPINGHITGHRRASDGPAYPGTMIRLHHRKGD